MKPLKIRPLGLLILFHVLAIAIAATLLVKQKGRPAASKETIVVVTIDGVIMNERGALARGVSVDSIVDAVNDFRDDDGIKALVLRIDSPGGSVGSVQEIYSSLLKFKEKGKPIVASFGDISASGGYYLASAADKIVCHPGTLTGSIGVIMELPNVEGLLGKVGVKMSTIKSGAMKDAGSPFRQMTEVERASFRTLILDAYSQFYAAVKEGRKMEDVDLKPLADGRVFSGKMAVEKKLVDELGDLEDAVDLAEKLAGLEGKNPNVVYHSDEQPLARLLEMFSQSPIRDLTALATRQKTRLMYMVQ